MMSFYLTPQSSVWVLADRQRCAGWWSAGLWLASGTGGQAMDQSRGGGGLLWVITSECQESVFAELHMCCLTTCVLQKSYPRNYFKSLSSSVRLLLIPLLVKSGDTCVLLSWGMTRRTWKSRRFKEETVVLLNNSVFWEKGHVYTTVEEISPWHFFPTAWLKFPNFVCESGDYGCTDTE